MLFEKGIGRCLRRQSNSFTPRPNKAANNAPEHEHAFHLPFWVWMEAASAWVQQSGVCQHHHQEGQGMWLEEHQGRYQERHHSLPGLPTDESWPPITFNTRDLWPCRLCPWHFHGLCGAAFACWSCQIPTKPLWHWGGTGVIFKYCFCGWVVSYNVVKPIGLRYMCF